MIWTTADGKTHVSFTRYWGYYQVTFGGEEAIILAVNNSAVIDKEWHSEW